MKQPLLLPRALFLLLLVAVVGMGSALLCGMLNASFWNVSHTPLGIPIIPTIPISTAPARCDQKPVSSQSGNRGIPAIKPHLCTIPTFTEQDVRDYMSRIKRFSNLRIEQISPHFMVTHVLFVTNKVANGILNAD